MIKRFIIFICTVGSMHAMQLPTIGFFSTPEERDIAEIQHLLDTGAPVDQIIQDGWPSLMYAARRGHELVVRLLLDAGASVNLRNKKGATALMWAARRGHELVVRLLLDAGASVNLRNKKGATALMWAAANNHEPTCKILVTHPIFNPFISESKFQESRQRIWTALLVFKRFYPGMPRDLRKLILYWHPETTRDVEIACIWSTHQVDAILTPHLPLLIVRLLVQNGKLDPDATVTALKAHHMECIKPFMFGAIPVKHTARLRAILIPDNLEANFGDKIERTIRHRLGLPVSKCVVQ